MTLAPAANKIIYICTCSHINLQPFTCNIYTISHARSHTLSLMH